MMIELSVASASTSQPEDLTPSVSIASTSQPEDLTPSVASVSTSQQEDLTPPVASASTLQPGDLTPSVASASISQPEDVTPSKPSNQYNESDAKTYSAAQNLCGMLLVALFLSLWTISCSIISWYGGSSLQYFMARYIVTLFHSIVTWIYFKYKYPEFANHKWYGNSKSEIKLLCIHGSLEFITNYLFFYALKFVYIGDVESISLFISPLIIAFVSKLFYKKKFPKNIILIIIIDFIGVLLVTQPSFIFRQKNVIPINPFGVILIIISMIAYSIDILIIGHNENLHWLQLQIYVSIQSLFIFTGSVLIEYCFRKLSTNRDGGKFDFGYEMLLCLVGIFGVVNVCMFMDIR